jgi:hypothetical protein
VENKYDEKYFFEGRKPTNAEYLNKMAAVCEGEEEYIKSGPPPLRAHLFLDSVCKRIARVKAQITKRKPQAVPPTEIEEEINWADWKPAKQLEVPPIVLPPVVYPELATLPAHLFELPEKPTKMNFIYEKRFIPDAVTPHPIRCIPGIPRSWPREKPYFTTHLYHDGILVVDYRVLEEDQDPHLSILIKQRTVTVWGPDLTVTMWCLNRPAPHCRFTRSSTIRPMRFEPHEGYFPPIQLLNGASQRDVIEPSDFLVHLPDRGLSVEIYISKRQVDIKGATRMILHIDPDWAATFDDVPEPRPISFVDAHNESFEDLSLK